MNRTITERIEAQRDGACDGLCWQRWQHAPFEVWPEPALRDYLRDTGHEHELDAFAPTGAELRAIVMEAVGCVVTADAKDEGVH
jgi:hypothetical protein